MDNLSSRCLQRMGNHCQRTGLWRFPWDLAWRNSGQVVSNLVQGNYPIQFRNVPGYLAIPFSDPVGVTNGLMTQVTNQCLSHLQRARND